MEGVAAIRLAELGVGQRHQLAHSSASSQDAGWDPTCPAGLGCEGLCPCPVPSMGWLWSLGSHPPSNLEPSAPTTVSFTPPQRRGVAN